MVRQVTTGRSFGEEGGRLTYGGYLRAAGAAGPAGPQADPPAHDELLFITVHQVYELWFQQVLYELEAARDAMTGGADLAGTAPAAAGARDRAAARRPGRDPGDDDPAGLPGVPVQVLAPASGFQSAQYRELEFLSGVKDRAFLARFRSLTGAERDRLVRRLAEPSLWDAYLGLLAARGLGRGQRARRSSRRCARSPGTGPPTTTCGSSRRTCSPTTSWPGSGGPGTCRWWNGRSGRSRVPGAPPGHRTCVRGCRCATTRCCGSCGTTCSGRCADWGTRWRRHRSWPACSTRPPAWRRGLQGTTMRGR